MDSLDLLARENEFKKLNKQLEMKTEKLMKEIENVMQKQDIFSEFSQNLSLNIVSKKCISEIPEILPPKNERTQSKQTMKFSTKSKNNDLNLEISSQKSNFTNHHIDNNTNDDIDNKEVGSNKNIHMGNCCAMMSNNSELGFLYAFVSVNVQNNVLPESFLKNQNITVETVCKFLSSKVKLLQDHVNKVQTTLDKKAEQCEKHLTHQAELESERLTMLNKLNNLKAEITETRIKCGALQNRLNEKERHYKEQRSETDKLTGEVKRLRSKNSSLEARFASQDETIEKLKSQLDASRRAEKEFRESTRALSTSNQNAISELENKLKMCKIRADKQNALIDNLRHQNSLLSSEGVLRAIEKDYEKFLMQDI